MYLFQNLRVRDRVLTSTPSYFDGDEVEDGGDDDSDKNELTSTSDGQVVVLERDHRPESPD